MSEQTINRSTKAEAIESLKTIGQFIGFNQISALKTAMRGEEKQFFFDMIVDLSQLIAKMSKTYEQDGKGEQAIAYLHYFKGSGDWYITEKDTEPDQYQAFGVANLGYGAELGYISIVELLKNDVELDLYFKPKTLQEAQK